MFIGSFLFTFSRYECVGNGLPELALTSVLILYWVTLSHKAGRDVVTTIVSNKVRLSLQFYTRVSISTDGRVVKALDSKSNGLQWRRQGGAQGARAPPSALGLVMPSSHSPYNSLIQHPLGYSKLSSTTKRTA